MPSSQMTISWRSIAGSLATVATVTVFSLSGAPNAVAQQSTKVAGINAPTSHTKLNTPARNPSFARTSVRGQMQIVVSIPDQRMDVYDGTVRVASTRVSTGKRGHATPRGVFSVIQKNRRHFSNIYNNAPMPYMQRLTWSGIALHAGAVPRYPASHGCIRMPHRFARKLFGMTDMNAHIVVNRGRSKPRVIDHSTLFHPRPRPVRNLAAAVNALTLDGLTGSQVHGRDMLVLREKKADAFAQHLRAAHHPNKGSRPRRHIILTQQMLIFLGLTNMKRPDGDLGPVTRKSIRAFQTSQGMKVTGRISPGLTRRLYTAVGHKMIGMDAVQANAMMTPKAIDAPLRILITRRSTKDDVKRAQQMLAQLGYDVGGADGVLGRNSREAIVTFREQAGLEPVKQQNAKVDTELLDVLAQETDTDLGDTMNGQIFIRQGHRDIYEAGVSIRENDKPLGTHVFNSMGYSDDRISPVSWTALSVIEHRSKVRKRKRNRKRKRRNRRVASNNTSSLPFRVASASSVLDRIQIPEDVRAYVEENLMPGSSMIVSDHGSSHETGEGTDFIVLTK